MILSKTPLRISFFSGGSDIASFYEKEDGAALSVTIDKFIYVCVHESKNIGLKIMFDKVEMVNDVEHMEHVITKEILKKFNKTEDVTVASVSDILSKGSGLGSSSAFTVGLINALNNGMSPSDLAENACDIEINKCAFPIGKQDQYAAAYGGFNLLEFHKHGNVTRNSCNFDKDVIKKLQSNLLLVYSGHGRDANNILQKQQNAISNKDKFDLVRRSRDKAYTGIELLNKGDIDSFGSLLHDAWIDKKNVVSGISQDYFDMVYEKAIKSGALGGKLLGAGGGGFFIFYVSQHNRDKVSRSILSDTECKIFDFTFTDKGSIIVYNDIE